MLFWYHEDNKDICNRDARNNFFNLLNQVMYEDLQVIIEKVGTEKKAVLTSEAEKEAKKKKEHEKTMKILKKTFGIWKDVPMSHFTDDRIHGKRAKEFLDKLRKADV